MMGQGVIVAVLSLLFYLTNLLGGSLGQPVVPKQVPTQEQSYFILGQTGKVLTDMTIRNQPQSDASPVTTAQAEWSVTILDKTTGWYKIRLDSGFEGWVPQYAISVSQVQPRSTQKTVMGLYPTNNKAYESLLAHSSQLTVVAPQGWQLNSYGELLSNFDGETMGKALYFAGNQQLETYAQIAFLQSPSRLLANNYLQEQSYLNIAQTLHEWGLKGVLLDFQYSPKGDEQLQVSQYINDLSAKLGAQNLGVHLALPWDEDLDYQVLAENVDYLILKTALQKEQLEPSPLQPVNELGEILADITQQVEPRKIIITLATGALDFPRSGLPTSLSHDQVLELAAKQGATIKWDSKQQAPYFNYGTGRTVWFENHYSLKPKLDLVKRHKLAGVAIADLGLEDQDIWPLIEKFSIS